jgi:hypothetical protein
VIWEPFLLALVLGLIVSAGLYFAYLWPSVEPAEEDAPEPAAAPAPDEDAPEPAAAPAPDEDAPEPAAAPPSVEAAPDEAAAT